MKKNVFKIFLSLAVMLAMVVSLTACGGKENKKSEYKKIGEGTENDFYLEVQKDEGKVSKYHVFTDMISVGDALEEIGLITFAETDKGELYVSKCDGKKLDYQSSKELWAVYLGDEYLSSNPCEVAIECGDIYTFKVMSLNVSGLKFPESKPEYNKNDEEEESSN